MNDCKNVLQACSICSIKVTSEEVGAHSCLAGLIARLHQKDAAIEDLTVRVQYLEVSCKEISSICARGKPLKC